jgi:hypothetical protein
MKLEPWKWFAAISGGLLAMDIMIIIWGPLYI